MPSDDRVMQILGALSGARSGFHSAVVAAAVGFYRSGSVVRVGHILIAIDALYLAVYTVVGALKALGTRPASRLSRADEA